MGHVGSARHGQGPAHRLARVEEPLPEGAAGMPGVIIPRKTVNELRKLAIVHWQWALPPDASRWGAAGKAVTVTTAAAASGGRRATGTPP